MNETVLLRNQIAALTKEHDEWMRSLEFSLKQRDKLNAERDEWVAKHKECTKLLGEALQDSADMAVERDALKDAAKLASRALNRIDAADIRLDTGERLSIAKAIAALKAVL